MKRLSIGKVARAANVRVDTIRYYERMGLISPPGRSESGYRSYTESDLRRLILIRRARAVGFSIQDIAQLLDAPSGNDPAAAPLMIRQKLDSIGRLLEELRRWHDVLQELDSPGQRHQTVAELLVERLGND